MYRIRHFVSVRGEDHVDAFTGSLPKRIQGKILGRIGYLACYGPRAKPPYVKFLRDKIYELRLSFGNLEIRYLYFYDGDNIVLTHGFLKKTDAVPEREIERAINMRTEYFGPDRTKEGAL